MRGCEPNGEQGMVTIALNTSAAREVPKTGLLPGVWSAPMLVGVDPPVASGLLLHGGYIDAMEGRWNGCKCCAAPIPRPCCDLGC